MSKSTDISSLLISDGRTHVFFAHFSGWLNSNSNFCLQSLLLFHVQVFKDNMSQSWDNLFSVLHVKNNFSISCYCDRLVFIVLTYLT